MIQLLPQLKILLAYQPVDFRKGIDGLIALCRAQFDAELYDGTLFVFRNRRGTALKILTFDGVGWWLVIRRFSQGRLQWWPKAQADTLTHPLEALLLPYKPRGETPPDCGSLPMTVSRPTPSNSRHWFRSDVNS